MSNLLAASFTYQVSCHARRVMHVAALKKLIPIVLFAMASTAQAASFDCSKATSLIEQKICASKHLSWLDKTVSETYETELSREDAASSIRSAQRIWLASRNRCADSICLETRYEERISALACDKQSRMAGSAIGFNLCTSMQTSLADRSLALLQERWMNKIIGSSNNPSNAKELVLAEAQAWRNYRDAQCALYGETEGGSDGWKNAWAGGCGLEETKKRLAYLTKQVETK